MLRRGPRNDRGQNMLEYTGIGIIVAATLVVIGSGNGLNVVPQGLKNAVCTVLGGDCVSTTGYPAENGMEADPNEAFKPDECETKTVGEKHGGTVKLGIVELGKEWELQKTKIQKDDGSTGYKVTMTSGGQAGVNGSTPGFNIGKVGAEIEVGADAKFGYGDTWEFKSKEEMDKFSEGLHQAWLDNIQEGSVPGYEMGQALRDDEPLPDPTSTISKGGFEASAEGTFEGGGDHGGTVELTPSGDRTTTRNATEGTTQTTEQFKIEGQGAGTYEKGPADGGNGSTKGLDYGAIGSSTGAMSVTRKGGKITEVEFVQTVEVGATADGKFEGTGGPGQDSAGNNRNGHREGGVEVGGQAKRVAVVTRKIPIETAQERATVDKWLSANNDFGSVAKTMGDSALAVIRGSESRPGVNASPMDRLIHDKAKTTRAMYNNHTEALEMQAEIKAGWALGASFSSERSTNKITDGEYLGAPDAKGERRYINFPECDRG